MKGLVVYFAIACLSLASGAPTEDESQVVSKSFNFDKKDVIFAMKPFSNDELVYAVCEGSSDDKKCKVYVESANQDTVQSCDLNLKYRNSFYFNGILFNAGNSKAVFAVRDGAMTRIKLISVNLKGCRIKETGVDVPLKLIREVLRPLQVVVVARENNYDVIYHNKDLCHDFLCKATFDYDGKVVKAPSTFPVPDLQSPSYEIESVNNAYLVSETYGTTNVYLVHENNTKPHVLFVVPRRAAGLSAEENKLGVCIMYVNRTLVCHQYDSEGKTKTNQVEITVARSISMEFLGVLNLEKGLLTVSVEIDIDNNERNIFVTHFDERGGMGKFVEVDLKCDKRKIVLPYLYKSSNGEYCVSSLCLAPLDHSENPAAFSRNTRCFHKAELF